MNHDPDHFGIKHSCQGGSRCNGKTVIICSVKTPLYTTKTNLNEASVPFPLALTPDLLRPAPPPPPPPPSQPPLLFTLRLFFN